METHIHLIRHGITIGLEKGYFYGWLDYPVTESGIDEIKENVSLNIYPEKHDYSKFYVSGLTRTIQTMNIIYGETPYEIVEDLREINFGCWEGHDYFDLEKKKEWNDWMNDFSGKFQFPKGDSVKSFFERVSRGFDYVVSQHETETFIICHGGVISAIMERCFKGEKEAFFKWTPQSSRGYSLTLDEKKNIISYKPI